MFPYLLEMHQAYESWEVPAVSVDFQERVAAEEFDVVEASVVVIAVVGASEHISCQFEKKYPSWQEEVQPMWRMRIYPKH